MILPLTRAIRSNATVAESPGAMNSIALDASPTSVAPERLRAKRLRLTKFAGDSDVLVTVTSRLYGSPADTISGWMKVSV